MALRLSGKRPGPAALAFLLMPLNLFAAAAGEANAIVIVADTRGLTGLQAWWANLYNESLLYFTLATVAIIPVTGLLLSMVTSFVMARTGINLKSRVLAEH